MNLSNPRSFAILVSFGCCVPLGARDFEWWTSERAESSQAVIATVRAGANLEFARQNAYGSGLVPLMELREREVQRLADRCKLPQTPGDTESTAEEEVEKLPGGGTRVAKRRSGSISGVQLIETHTEGRQLSVLLSVADPARWTRNYLDSLLESAEKSKVFPTAAERRKAGKRVDEIASRELERLRRERLTLVGWEVSSVSGIGFSDAASSAEARRVASASGKKRAEKALEFAIRAVIDEWKRLAVKLELDGKHLRDIADKELIESVKSSTKLGRVAYQKNSAGLYVHVSPKKIDWIDELLGELEKRSLGHEKAAGDSAEFRKAMAKLTKREKAIAARASKDVAGILEELPPEK